MRATRKVVIGAAALAGLAVLIWLRSSRSGPEAAHQPLTAAPRAAESQPLSPTAANRPASKQSPASIAESGEAVEICGVGKVRLPADDAGGEQYAGALTQRAEARSIAALQESRDPHARAVGLMLAGPEQSEPLAQLALQSGDPALYDLALSDCARGDAAAACRQISPQTWAQLDGDNAEAWLEVAWQQRRAGDVAGERDAMQRAAAAHRFEDYAFSLLGYAESNLPADLSALERYYLEIQVIGIETASGASSHAEASKYCAKNAVSDALVREQCRAVADLLDVRGSTLLDLAIARSIGARVGWGKERVDSSAKYAEAMMAGLERDAGAAQWSCGALAASNAYLRELSRQGEIVALRERLEQSGESVMELAQQHRQYLEKMIADAAVRASADENPQADPR
jgi:hypothetical protein